MDVRWRQEPRLGNRILRFGATGEDVLQLQRALVELGYDPGPLDGSYGYLTAEAVRRLQREHQLRPDGVAGPRVFALLTEEAVRRMRILHEVRPGEGLNEIAGRYGVAPAALRRANGLPPRGGLYPGRRLVIRVRQVLGLVAPEGIVARHALRDRPPDLSGIVPLWYTPQADGSLQPRADEAERRQLEAWAANGQVALWTGVQNLDARGRLTLPAGQLLLERAVRRRLAEALAQLGEGPGPRPERGLLLDLAGLRWGEGLALYRLVEAVAELRRRGQAWPLAVSVPPPLPSGRWRLPSDLPYHALSQLADQLLVATHHPPGPAGQPWTAATAEVALQRLLDQVPPWKVWLGVPVGAWWRHQLQLARPEPAKSEQPATAPEPPCAGLEAPPAEEPPVVSVWERLSYQLAVATAYRHGARPRWDEELGVAHALLPEQAELWLENRESAARWLALVERYNLAGVVLYRLGDEDRRFWELLPRYFKVWRPPGPAAPAGKHERPRPPI